ncbi:MAG: hypothetical protein JWN44_4422 [Myxococcales bacterium]|nr:hypothetical protein [Myxococcales bacterium]
MIASDVASSPVVMGGSEHLKAPVPALPLGEVLCGRYCLTRRIARGGSAVVFCALDELLGELVALKVLLPSDHGEMPAILREEALAAMRLTHPAIVRVFTYERDVPWEFLVMEHINGPSLSRHLSALPGQRLRPAATVRLGIECLDALAYAHEAGVVHNDLKPSNILLTLNGTVKLCDFGLTSPMVASARSRGEVLGTPAYLSPERIRGGAGDARSDLYSLAATLYAVGNGQLAFCGTGMAQMRAHLRIPPPPSPHLPKRLHEVLRRALAKRPDERYQTAREMQQALREAAEELGFASGRSGAQPEDGVPSAVMPECSSGAGTSIVTSSAVAPLPPPVAPLTLIDGAQPEPTRSGELEIIIERELPAPAEPNVIAAPGQMVWVSGRELRSLWGGRFTIQPLWIDRTPVTIEMYAAFVRETGHMAPADWLGGRPPSKHFDHPVTHVTLDDARAYACWRGGRLPTSLEWEAVARGPHCWRFPWGDRWDASRCHGGSGGADGTAAVDAHPAGRSIEGCLDLVGNVWEWTEPDPRADASLDGQVWVYGGSFRHGCEQQGALPRTRVMATKSYAYLGFRCAAAPNAEPGERR